MMDFDVETAVQAAIARKSDAEREEELRLQAERLAQISMPTPLQVRASLGRRIETTARKELVAAPSDEAHDRLAEGLALQGLYHAALEAVRGPRLRASYEEVIAAAANTTPCACPKRQNGQDTSFVKDTVLFEDRVIHLRKCILCKTVTC